jgi:FG-GAP repeat
MRRYILTLYGLPFIMLMWSLLLPGPAEAQLIQHGPKLVGTGAAGAASQGTSVVLSGDGNTAVVGGVGDNANTGAAWVYIRSDGVWNQQAKLVGSGAVGGSFQGFSVSLSSDGNTAIVGGISDNGSSGAAWVYTRSGSVWSQQGPKLVGTGAVGPRPAIQGFSVSLSDNGNTAIVGGPYDNSSAGAAWVYTRSDGVWSQQAKLVGTGALSLAEQGHAVSLSGDGNTAIVGGFADNSSVGAAWVYTRSDGVWSQQAKLVGAGASTPAAQGISVSLSGDGNTAIVGGPSGPSGAAWVSALAVCGASKRCWSAQALWAEHPTDFLCRSPTTGIPPSSAGLMTTASPVPRGCTPARTVCGASKRSWSALAP